MSKTIKVIALEGRLRDCGNVITLGVRPNFSDYQPREMDLIRNANKIYYPSLFYADLFDTMGKPTFPSYHCYKFGQDKIKQTALFELLNISHPRTRVFYGKRQKKTITDHFAFPFVAKIARGSAMGRGVYLIRNSSDLEAYLQQAGIVNTDFCQAGYQGVGLPSAGQRSDTQAVDGAAATAALGDVRGR